MSTFYRKRQQNDLDLEAESIDKIKDFLQGHFQVQLIRTGHYHKFDFMTADELVFFEVKSRRNSRDRYPTTMIPAKKLEFARTRILPKGGKAYFVFHFTDCLAYIEYSEELFSTFEKRVGGRFDRGGPELNDYCFIPVNELTLLSGYTAETPQQASSCQRE